MILQLLSIKNNVFVLKNIKYYSSIRSLQDPVRI